MSFMDNLTKMAGQLLGGVDQQSAANAAGEHVAQMDPQELAGHLKDSVGSMDPSTLTALGQHLLETFTSHQAYSGDGAQAAAEAGTSAEAVASGSPAAISSLVEYAKGHPEVLQTAASAFMQRNPGALTQLAPGLLGGIMAKLGINSGQPPAE
jgi:hypothetical protein